MPIDKDQVRQAVVQIMNLHAARKFTIPNEYTEEEKKKYLEYIDSSSTPDIMMWDIFSEEISRFMSTQSWLNHSVSMENEEEAYEKIYLLLKESKDSEQDTLEQALALFKVAIMVQSLWSNRLGFPEMFEEVQEYLHKMKVETFVDTDQKEEKDNENVSDNA